MKRSIIRKISVRRRRRGRKRMKEGRGINNSNSEILLTFVKQDLKFSLKKCLEINWLRQICF
jgi:hypothetical protein